jgi:hypothetical protein
MVSDLRLVIVDHAAQKGNWSLFNPRGGFTVMIPLHDRDCRAGTHSLIAGSHFLADRQLGLMQRLWMSVQRLICSPFPISVTDLSEDGRWHAGDALVIDNRLLIRSEENSIFNSGTYILIKYETCENSGNVAFWSGKLLFRLASLIEKISEYSNPKYRP